MEELHYAPFARMANANDFVPSRLDIRHDWPHLRRSITSDVFVTFQALTLSLSPHIESVEYHISDTDERSSARVFQAMIPQLKVGSQMENLSS